jgi:hypothetical protein
LVNRTDLTDLTAYRTAAHPYLEGIGIKVTMKIGYLNPDPLRCFIYLIIIAFRIGIIFSSVVTWTCVVGVAGCIVRVMEGYIKKLPHVIASILIFPFGFFTIFLLPRSSWFLHVVVPHRVHLLAQIAYLVDQIQ